MRFLWLCRNISERFPDLVADIVNGTAEFWSNVSSRFSDSSGHGCYRDGQYIISNTTDLELTTTRMTTDETYQIVLLVKKDSRTSSTTQLLELSLEDIPKLTIR